ncbi:MAG: hypothetical protein GXX84_04505 [Acidobacteria bacterium]|nr:hypothetical protein [Acidobacteriota bacterium]
MNRQPRESDIVKTQTPPRVLNRIEKKKRKIEESIRHFALQPEHLLSRRIEELDRKWDIERVLEVNASILGLSGLLLSLKVDKRFLLLTGGALGFLLQHSLTGWCPPVFVLRRLGFRTRQELDREKFALKALRGDFQSISPNRSKKTPSPQ